MKKKFILLILMFHLISLKLKTPFPFIVRKIFKISHGVDD